MIKQDVLNAGYVRLVEHMGGDESVSGARLLHNHTLSCM